MSVAVRFWMLLIAALWLTGCAGTTLPVPVALPTATPFTVSTVAPEPTPTPNPEPVTLRYAMWSARQFPAYSACAEQFMADNPHITIEIEQIGGGDYWPQLDAALRAGDAPDVFVNHITRLPDLAAGGFLLDLEPLMTRDGVDDSIYIGRLPRLWMRAGVRYGLPKDWDTIALVYNRTLLEDAGVTPEMLAASDWNPRDGGSFQELLARLTVDAEGRNALEPEFDATSVRHYGLTMPGTDGGGAYGQAQWSNFAVSNGFRFTDFLFADQYHYDSAALIDTFAWFQSLIHEEGYHTPMSATADGQALFLDGRAALITDGSWTISTYADDAPFDIGFVPLPVGPDGRKSMLNSLADSIWAGTAHPEEAWLWVKHLGSVACQVTVGEHGVVFPALQSGVERMIAHYDARGIDVRPFAAYLRKDSDEVFLFPVTEQTAAVDAIMRPVVSAILVGDADPAAALPAANAKVNALFLN